MDDFLDSVYARFDPDDQYKIQGYVEIINQQQSKFTIAESTRVWLTNPYAARHFNDFVWNSIKSEIVKRIIVNGLTGSSWYFKRFNRLTTIASSVKDVRKIMSG